ncbi:MAG: nucleoside triphosphate pyrophosphohydrolase [Bryobacterales bacterium]|nr:nucleoside triphosphate pyrophosphohydrolase [Bryobacterales bacterium]
MGDSSIPSSSDQPSSHAHAAQAFARLLSLMAQLRAENGCPWDREQTFDSIKPYTLEETYEVLDAIDRRDFPGLCEELGDFVLQAVFHAQMASEQGLFTIADSLDAINEKLVRRHPHIFAEAIAETSADVKHRWDEIKKQEKAAKGIEEQSLLDGVLRSAPALVEAQEISKRAAKVGFDWPDISQVAAKVREELDELAEARDAQDAAHIEEEFGDLLFSAVNLARFLHVDAEQALRKANAKFRRRFAHVEHALAAEGKQLKDSTLDEMEAKWIEAKQQS